MQVSSGLAAFMSVVLSRWASPSGGDFTFSSSLSGIDVDSTNEIAATTSSTGILVGPASSDSCGTSCTDGSGSRPDCSVPFPGFSNTGCVVLEDSSLDNGGVEPAIGPRSITIPASDRYVGSVAIFAGISGPGSPRSDCSKSLGVLEEEGRISCSSSAGNSVGGVAIDMTAGWEVKAGFRRDDRRVAGDEPTIEPWAEPRMAGGELRFDCTMVLLSGVIIPIKRAPS
ncbi:uncharacterized protein HMPREF1120_06226 [Exophiala dermatitidis NIH/UT8656]|uniref:Uncharacterized protein n=1 Tax=Exophiala dermatitidis (strain ATCC 34100 / CBS 525.76 / NIH/UT8656) TaxID=858893 RepID=H6C3J9_EXODN|nr:uncharacterized protein HMPREF1120_06226 [Exophiala dermatitidis NIH/UT8656]EHY58214.1 hypothetical protein HMPREF1120_06226 [Exophiala dermatitidis NIH/UT8656]